MASLAAIDPAEAAGLVSVPINGYDVLFPFQPYDAQITYMECVVTALENQCNALLESPTGTGKTLCLLSATLAWLVARKMATTVAVTSKPPKVIYCSRTHAQLSQVIREYKRTPYSGKLSMALLGSREHLCVNNDVLRVGSANAQNALCSTLRRDRGCRFFNKYQRKEYQLESAVCDMEDIVKEGRRSVFCPYFYERDTSETADIVFMPYNYILDETLRRQLPFDPKGSILIVDEAHNLPAQLSAAGCHDLLPLDLAAAIQDCSKAVAAQRMRLADDAGGGSSGGGGGGPQEGEMLEQELASLKLLLHRLETAIQGFDLKAGPPHPGSGGAPCVVRPGRYILDFLAQQLITRQLFYGDAATRGLNEVLTKAIELLSETDASPHGMSRVLDFFTTVFGSAALAQSSSSANSSGSNKDCGREPDASRFIVRETSGEGGGKKVLGFWKLDNSDELQGLADSLSCMLFTSGTLSPLEHFEADLGVACPVKLQGRHVIQPEQVLGCVVCAGPGRERLNGSYGMRDSAEYRRGVGMMLVNAAQNVPGGVLVFFSSYSAMNGCILSWKTGAADDAQTIWGLLSARKPLFVEPKSSADLRTIVAEFQQTVDRRPRRGAVLFAVSRGKVSEGVDFADHHGRCVFAVGIPFANHADLFVQLKKGYLTEVAPRRALVEGKPYTGDVWYRHEAMRAVNQCVGRVIRHKDDYGCVVFADERFAGTRSSLPEWIACRTQLYHDFSGFFADVTRFFSKYIITDVDGGGSGGGGACGAPAAAVAVAAAAASPAIAEVPRSAEKALRYAEERDMAGEAEGEWKRQVRRRLEAANSFEPGGSDGPAPPSSIPHSTSSSRFPRMQKQVLPPSGTAAVATVAPATAATCAIGPSSKEFCAFLKQHTSEGDYQLFKNSLRSIATLTSKPPKWEEEFAAIVRSILEIFDKTAEYATLLRKELGRHLPPSFLPLYSQLT